MSTHGHPVPPGGVSVRFSVRRIAQREAAFFAFLKARTLSKDVGSTTSATDR